jgi:hypothetical protein
MKTQFKYFIPLLLMTGCIITKNKHKSATDLNETNQTKPLNGNYLPTEKGLSAISIFYPDASLEKLNHGYYLYHDGACVSCHKAKNIYEFNKSQWKLIIDDMSAKAQLKDHEKEAVYQYVFSIKLTQPN